jgi:hypothetical protein
MSGKIYAVFPTFYMGNIGDGTIGEITFDTELKVQVGIEPVFQNSNTITAGARVASAPLTIPANTSEKFVVLEVDLGSTVPCGGMWILTIIISRVHCCTMR